MWKKRLAVLSGLILCVGAISAVAMAQEDGGGSGKGEEHISGTGALWARGTGNVDIDADRGKVQMRLTGDITITGPADLDVRINGLEHAMIEGGQTVVVLTDFDGTVGVRGTDFTIDADGDIALRGRGSGSVTLTGTGHWKTLHDQGRWTGVELALPS